MSDHYRVKFVDEQGKTHYGTVQFISQVDPKQKRPAPGHVFVNDAVKPVYHDVPESALVDLPLSNFEQDPEKMGEYDRHVHDAHEQARKTALATPEKGVHVGSMFRVGVADGQAVYVVKEVGKRNCRIEWLGDGGDNYMDHYFGRGGSFPIAKIRRYIEGWRAMAKLFPGRE